MEIVRSNKGIGSSNDLAQVRTVANTMGKRCVQKKIKRAMLITAHNPGPQA